MNALRIDGRAKARGEAVFAADAVPRPHLVGALITSRLAHSRVRVDTLAALAIPGVVAVLGPEDDPGIRFSTDPHAGRADTSVFAAESRFAGDIVGAIAAENRSALAAGLAAVFVAEQPLPAIVDLAAARRPDAAPSNCCYPSNLIDEIALGADEQAVRRALASAPYVFEHAFDLDPTPHGFLERVAAAAEWRDGRCHIWSTTQCPCPVRDILARLLSVTPDDVVLEPVFIGGGFGGKEEVALEPVAALLSQACGGQPVLVELDRAACTSGYRTRHGGRIVLRTGTDANGRFLLRDSTVDFNGGAYDGHSATVTANAATTAFLLYRAPVRRSIGRCWSTNTTPAGAFRGYGGPQAVFAVESHVDEIARHLGVDPIEIRRTNCLRAGDIDAVQGWPVESFNLLGCLDRAAETMPPATDDNADAGGRFRRGVGVAALMNVSGASYRNHLERASAACRVESDGGIVVETTVPELGQGNLTVFAGIAAEALGVDPGCVTVERRRAGEGPYDQGVFGSRGSYITGSAVHLAATALGDDLRARAAALGDGPVRAEATFTAPDNALVAGVQVAEVQVDTWTGVVTVERVTSIHDIGRVLHPVLARGQVEGGVVQGIGVALSERLAPRSEADGDRRGFFHHLIPTTACAPVVEAVFVAATPHPHSATGAKGLGEAPIVGVAPAVANAIRDATGVRLTSLPMTPERVLYALDQMPLEQMEVAR